jgi:lipoprotein-anchoring transpeptidase ErfK/SrfK
MKGLGQIQAAAVAVIAVFAMQTMAQTGQQRATKNLATTSNEATQTHPRRIVVSLEDRKLALVEDGQVKKIYTVAVGKPATPSPVGTFMIERRVMNPTYSHDGKIVPAGPGNPVGTRWMGLSVKGYGIHGTNAPGSIGKAASHGCIRMGKADLEDLYSQMAVGDTVEIVGQRNEETAELFGGGVQKTAAMQMAKSEPAAQTPATTSARGSATGVDATALAAAIAGAL